MNEDLWDQMDAQGRIVDKDWIKHAAIHRMQDHLNFTPEDASKLLYHYANTHCYPMNIPKEKIIRIWNMRGADPGLALAVAPGPYATEETPWVSAAVTEVTEAVNPDRAGVMEHLVLIRADSGVIPSNAVVRLAASLPRRNPDR